MRRNLKDAASPEEMAALHSLLLENSDGNARIAATLFKIGDGAWPERVGQYVATTKFSRFGFSKDDGKIDLNRAPNPMGEANAFWELVGLEYNPGNPYRAARRDVRNPRTPKAERRVAVAKYFAGGDLKELTEEYGLTSVHTFRGWVREFRNELEAEEEAVRKTNPKPSSTSPTLPPMDAGPKEGGPTTEVTVNDGAGIKMTFTINEHPSSVVAKLMELSRQ